MRTLAVFFCLIIVVPAFAQTAPTPGAEALAKDTKTLNERFVVLKDKSQTFKDYKVIKETVLDAMFRLIIDSVKAQKASIIQARKNIAALDSSLVGIKRDLQLKQDSMEEVEHASTHITVIGIDFQKGVFLTITGILLAALVVLIAVILARLKMIHRSYKEKADTVEELNHEYEEFKRKSMDKQTKLSRELQDERNKLQAMFKA
jgi:chromosome segregation ATPase